MPSYTSTSLPPRPPAPLSPCFLKLGGSLITDKTAVSTIRPAILRQLADEIAAARAQKPELRLLLGHGGGSFGHVAAAKHGTRDGVKTAVEWYSFARVHASMARLNQLVIEALLAVGVPAIGLQPSAHARAENGRLTHITTAAIRAALDANLVPVIYGDTIFDTIRGGTILSTEELMIGLVDELRPSRLLLAGETMGVYDENKKLIPIITPASYKTIAPALQGSRGTDVTGGMASKVEGMLALVTARHSLTTRIFSGMNAGNVTKLLVMNNEVELGTLICS